MQDLHGSNDSQIVQPLDDHNVDNNNFVHITMTLIVIKQSFFVKVTTHLKDMFRSCNDHLQLKVELI